MNPLKKFKDNPAFGQDDHGDLWTAINRCYIRVAVVDERVRVALLFCLPILGFLVSLDLFILGILLT